jgi:site-specific recombinase XerD
MTTPITTNDTAPPSFPELDAFMAALEKREASVHTIAAYRPDLSGFAVCFRAQIGAPCTLTTITATDVRDQLGSRKYPLTRQCSPLRRE